MAIFQAVNNLMGLKATAVALVIYIAVKYDGTEDLVLIAGAGDDIVGFTREAADADAVVEIASQGGGALAVAGGNISQGDRLKVDAAGKLVVASTADDLSVAIARGDAVLDDVFGVYVETLRIHA